ncbi:MAG: helix-turn-helix domain-containing protein [Hyphomonadaceae bacterium]
MSARKQARSDRTKMGSAEKRGSFFELIEEIGRDDVAHGRSPAVAGAAFRAAAIVRAMRKAGGLSQVDLAKRLGLSQARISEIEAGLGAQGPTWDLMERIASACDSKILISPHDTGLALDAAEFPESLRYWKLAALPG